MFRIALIALVLQLAATQNYKTVLFTRHGARSPKIYTEIDTNYLWKIPAEDLTAIGLNQHMKLGERNRRPQIYDAEGNCIYERIEVQASTTARVVMSTIGFIKGLCPKNYAPILHRLFREKYEMYSNNAEAFLQIQASDFTDPLSLDVHYFERPNDFMFHGHKNSVCPALKPLRKNIEKSDTYKKQQSKFLSQSEFDEVADIIKAAYPSKDIHKKDLTLEDITDIYDDYYSNHVEGFNFPSPSLSAVKYMEEVTRFQRYYLDNSEQLEHMSSLTQPFQWLIAQLNNDLSFSWYSGHDSNQVAVLAVITDQQPIVPFASQLEFTVKDGIVNVFFNDIQLSTKFCTQKINCTIKQTVEYLLKFVASDLQSLCAVKSQV